MPDAGTPPPRTSELTVGPAEPLDADPSATRDRLGLGRDPDRPGLLERLRGLPAVRAVADRPWPRTVVAVVSALVSGAGVAVYLGGPPEEAPAAEPEPILRPESWLEVTEGIAFLPEPVELDPEQQALVEQELARHPADAPVVLALGARGIGTINGREATLLGVPPGRYRLQATCAPPPEPVWQVHVVAAHNDDEVLVINMPCDGDFHAADPPLHLTDYRAYFFSWYPTVEADPTIEGDPFPFESLSKVVVVVSLVPMD